MHRLITIKNKRWADSNRKEMIYTDEDGKEYLGSPRDVIIGENMRVELAEPIDGEPDGRPRRII